MSVIPELRAAEAARVIGGHIVQTRGEERPYKVVLQYEGAAADSEHPVATIREGEALIRQRSPQAAKVSKLREWNLPL